MGAPRVAQPFPFFKETETNSKCCGCGNGNGRSGFGAPSEIPQVVGMNPAQFNTMPSSTFLNNGHHFMKVDNSASIEMLRQPIAVGTGQITGAHTPRSEEFEKARTQLNLDLVHRDK